MKEIKDLLLPEKNCFPECIRVLTRKLSFEDNIERISCFS